MHVDVISIIFKLTSLIAENLKVNSDFVTLSIMLSVMIIATDELLVEDRRVWHSTFAISVNWAVHRGAFRWFQSASRTLWTHTNDVGCIALFISLINEGRPTAAVRFSGQRDDSDHELTDGCSRRTCCDCGCCCCWCWTSDVTMVVLLCRVPTRMLTRWTCHLRLVAYCPHCNHGSRKRMQQSKKHKKSRFWIRKKR